MLLRGCGQWYRCGRERVARPSEQENLDPQPQRNRRRQEDVSKGEPSRGQTASCPKIQTNSRPARGDVSGWRCLSLIGQWELRILGHEHAGGAAIGQTVWRSNRAIISICRSSNTPAWNATSVSSRLS